MAVTAPVSLSKVRTEFQSTNPNLRAYNRGGGRVPNIPVNSNIATDPNLLRLSQFLGASISAPAQVQLSDQFVSDMLPSGNNGTLTAGFGLDPSGLAFIAAGQFGQQNIPGEWGTGVNGLNYECRVVNLEGNGGVFTGPALGVWHPFTQQRVWFLTSDIIADHSFYIRLSVEIRTTSLQLVASAIFMLEVRRGQVL